MRELICISCPNGCLLTVEEQAGELRVEGHLCPKGVEFARSEIIDAKRTVCTTVKTIYPDFQRLPVKTDGEIPKGLIFKLMSLINDIEVSERLHTADVILKDVLGTGVNLISTVDMELYKEDDLYV